MNNKHHNGFSVLVTVLVAVSCIALMFFFFCFVEAFALLFTHGTFSFALPALVTAFAILAFIALAIVGGAAE